MNLKNVIQKPIITEKSLSQTPLGKYTFAVDRQASKGQIKTAVEKYFKVNVVDVTTVSLKGKKKRIAKTRRLVKLADQKKAVVQLREGQKIDYFETGGTEKKS